MKKVIRLTENDLVKLIKKVMNEQSTGNKISSVSNTQPKSKDMISTVKMVKSNPKDWFNNFPCLKMGVKFVGDKAITTDNSQKQSILLAQSGKNDKNYQQVLVHDPYGGYVGQVQGGGVYFCPSSAPQGLLIYK